MPHLGDHRFAVLDINAATLVGASLIKIVCPAARRFSCSIPSAMASSNKCLDAHMQQHKMLPKLHQLYVARNGAFTPAQCQQLEVFDRARAEGMLHVEKQECRKLSMGNVDFSSEVDLAKKRRWLWQQVVEKCEGRKMNASLINRKARQCGILCPLSVTLAQACQHF
jgi:hypothetical protein